MYYFYKLQKEWNKMKHDSGVLKEFLKAQPGEKEFGVCIRDKESVQVRNYCIILRKIGEESMHDRNQQVFFPNTHHTIDIMS